MGVKARGEDVKPWDGWTWSRSDGVVRHDMRPLTRRALAKFNSIEAVKLEALLGQRGVGRKTLRDIAEAFKRRGYPQFAQDLEAWKAGRPERMEQQRAERAAKAASDARLAAAAPDLARVLLAVEWTDMRDTQRECPSCRAIESEGHAPDCALDAALRKAGAR